MGASNELPESEELDALYDRFLIRRQVAQVSSAQLSTLARIAAGGRLQEIVPGAQQPAAKAGELTMDDYRSVASWHAYQPASAGLQASVAVRFMGTQTGWLIWMSKPPRGNHAPHVWTTGRLHGEQLRQWTCQTPSLSS